MKAMSGATVIWFAVLDAGVGAPRAGQPFIVVASTTSTEQSGLFAHLLPAFEKDTGIKVRVVAVGTGQALDIGRRGDADVVFVHDKAAEHKWLAEGEGVKRYPVMYNDFVLDRAEVRSGARRRRQGHHRRTRRRSPTRRRRSCRARDKSGTHAAELRLWKDAGVDIDTAKGPWYRETGSGMGPALNTASAMNAYILADRGTWLSRSRTAASSASSSRATSGCSTSTA